MYEKELKVCSLEGLQYLAKQLQLLSSKYPGREIKTAHMVSFGLRSHVIAAWNSQLCEGILFLGKGIPQSSPVNTENFSKFFYIPLIKTFNDMPHLYDLLSEETSNTSNNKSKMPVSGYGTRETPGHIALWLISLGSQKETIQQLLG